MSAIEFLMQGGMASTGGDLPESEQKECNELIKKFGNKVREPKELLRLLPLSKR